MKTYLKPSPYICPNTKEEIGGKRFITDWKTLGDFLILNVGTLSMVFVPSDKLVYLHLKESNYLYNKNL